MSLLFAAQAIDALANETVDVIRPNVGSYVGGRWVEPTVPAVTPASIQCCLFEVKASDLEQLPEALRSRRIKSIWTRFDLRCEDQSNKNVKPDVIRLASGIEYRVEKIQSRVEGGFTKAIIGEIDARINTI